MEKSLASTVYFNTKGILLEVKSTVYIIITICGSKTRLYRTEMSTDMWHYSEKKKRGQSNLTKGRIIAANLNQK